MDCDLRGACTHAPIYTRSDKRAGAGGSSTRRPFSRRFITRHSAQPEGAHQGPPSRSRTRSTHTCRSPGPRLASSVRDRSSSPSTSPTSPVEETAADANRPVRSMRKMYEKSGEKMHSPSLTSTGLRARRRANGAHTQHGDCVLATVDYNATADVRRCQPSPSTCAPAAHESSLRSAISYTRRESPDRVGGRG